MKKIWSRLEGELTSKASEILESLNLGADESDVEALEEYVGQELPTDYRDFLIMHNGQSQESNPGFFDMFSLMPLDLVQESWDELEGLRDDAGEDETCPGDWLPFAEDGSGDMLCVELESGAISKYVSNDENEELADSFEGWLADIHSILKNGEFSYDPASGFGIQPKGPDEDDEEDDGSVSGEDEDDVVMDSDDDDDETAMTYKFTAKMIELYEGEEKVGNVPWGDINKVRVSSYAGDPLISINLPEGSDPEELEIPANVSNSDKLFKYLGKLKGWDKEAFEEALANADKDEEILVWG
jgi:cell wall assembly regulator SMI1